MTEIPVLTTARLVLRAPHANDFPAYRDFMARRALSTWVVRST